MLGVRWTHKPPTWEDRPGYIHEQEGVLDGSWLGFLILRSAARALDWAAAGAVPVDHPHGTRCSGRLLDLHLGAVLTSGARPVRVAGTGCLSLRRDRDRPARQARAL